MQGSLRLCNLGDEQYQLGLSVTHPSRYEYVPYRKKRKEIRIVRQNHRIIESDVCNPACARRAFPGFVTRISALDDMSNLAPMDQVFKPNESSKEQGTVIYLPRRNQGAEALPIKPRNPGACLAGAPYAPDPVSRFPSVLLKRPFNRIDTGQTTKNVPRLKWVFQIWFD